MAILTRGDYAALATTEVRAVLSWTEGATAHDIDLCALLVDADGQVSEDRDFVFYNQPSHPSNAVRHEGRHGTSECVSLDVGALPDAVDRVVVAASISGDTFGSVHDLTIALTDPATGSEEARFDATGAAAGSALVLVEILRRDDVWTVRAVGDGRDSGLAGLAASHGVNIGGSAPTDEAPALDLPRRRITAVSAPRGHATLDSGSLTLPIGGTVLLSGVRVAAPNHVWLRVTSARSVTPPSVDLCALTYDSYGTVRDVIYYGQPGTTNGSLGLVNRPIGTTAEATSAVEVALEKIDHGTSGIVLAATSYRGDTLGAVGSLVTELVDETGASLVRTECPETRTSSALLVSLTRGDDGVWFLTALGSPANARTAKSLVGAGFWALSA